jgi:hypothetical protein
VSGGAVSSITSGFNRAPIAGGDSIWFTSVLRPAGLGTAPVTIFVRSSAITFTAAGTDYSVPAPDANVVFSPDLTVATATFDAANNLWEITVPSGLSGDTLLDAVSFLVPPEGLPGGIQNVTWSAAFSTDTAGVTLQWKWTAAVYPPSFGTDYNALGVKPVDDPEASQYDNSDNAGTPESFKTEVISGAMGDGRSNYTGGYCTAEQSKARDHRKHDHRRGRCSRDADHRERGRWDGGRAGKDDPDRGADRGRDRDDDRARPQCGGSHPKTCPALVTPTVIEECGDCGGGGLPT